MKIISVIIYYSKNYQDLTCTDKHLMLNNTYCQVLIAVTSASGGFPYHMNGDSKYKQFIIQARELFLTNGRISNKISIVFLRFYRRLLFVT